MGKVWPADAVSRNVSTTALSNIVSIDESPLREGFRLGDRRVLPLLLRIEGLEARYQARVQGDVGRHLGQRQDVVPVERPVR